MPHIDVDPSTYATVRAVAEREGRLLKGVVRLAVQAAYGTAEHPTMEQPAPVPPTTEETPS